MSVTTTTKMPTYKKIVHEGWRKAALKEFLKKYLSRAGFHDADLVITPLREMVTVYVERPGLAIGKSGRLSKRLTELLKQRFGFENPYLRAEKVEEPFLSARLIAHFIAARIARGERHRRVAFIAMRRALSAGARGIEIKIAGKFGSQRAREERFRAGVIYRCGEDLMRNVEYAVEHILLPQGMMGVRVRIVRPEARTPDQVIIKEDRINELLEEVQEGAGEEPSGSEERASEEVKEAPSGEKSPEEGSGEQGEKNQQEEVNES